MRPARLAVSLALAAGLACAAGIGDVRAADTVLHLSETATVTVPPDELAAILRVEAIRSTATEAQAQVNRDIQAALITLRGHGGLVVTTGGYNVWRVAQTPQDSAERWQATQSLALYDQDGGAVLSIVGDLQQRGLSLSTLNWRLSRATEHKAHQEALKRALVSLRAATENAASLLNLKFAQFREVRLESPTAMPVPMLRGLSMAAAAPAAPSAAADDIVISATVEAEALLTAH